MATLLTQQKVTKKTLLDFFFKLFYCKKKQLKKHRNLVVILKVDSSHPGGKQGECWLADYNPSKNRQKRGNHNISLVPVLRERHTVIPCIINDSA